MSLNRFGKHSSSMVIDKFGKHVHGHNIVTHLKKRRYLRPTIILTFSGDGTTDKVDNYFIIQNLGYVKQYINYFYVGEIVSSRFEGNVQLIIDGKQFDPNDLNYLSFGNKIVCKSTVTPTLLKQPFSVELVIELSTK